MLLKMLNPKNLQKEISCYGYKFSYKSYLMALVATLTGAVLLGKLMYLDYTFIAVIAVVAVVCIPFFILSLYKRMYEQKRFSDAGRYIESTMYAFINRGQILQTLREVSKTFEDGTMKTCIDKAVDFIIEGKYKSNLYLEAFAFIENEYANERIATVNRFMLSASEIGGERQHMAEIYIADKEEWAFNIGALQSTKKKILNEIYGACLATIIFCFFFLYMETKVGIEIAKVPAIQWTSTALIILQLIVILMGNNKMATNWLEYNFDAQEKAALKEYWYLKKYDEKKEKIESLLWAAPLFIGAIALAVFRHYQIAVLCGALGVLMLSQHKLNYQISYKKVVKSVKVAFPEWITTMTLLLQNHTVFNAMKASMDNAPAILKPELEQLVDEIKKNPENIAAYQSFFAFLNLDEVKTAMQILYTLSETGNGDMKTQLHSLQSTNMKLKNVSEKIKQEDIVTDMDLIKSAPTVICCIVQFIYLMMFMNVGPTAINVLGG